jgi:PadR family transcriptional regulator, regulatory protein PadR
VSNDKNAQPSLRGNAPTLVLLVLRSGPRHGYDIAREIEQRSENTLVFQYGTLYPTLHALERDGFIVGQDEHPPGERPRRVFTITDKGVVELEERLKRWKEFSRAMDRLITGEA